MGKNIRYVGLWSSFFLAFLCTFIYHILKRKGCKKGAAYVLLELLVFVCWTILGVITVDTVFSYLKSHNVMIDSELTYGDATALLVTLLGSVTIAFFQHRIQEGLAEEQQAREAEKKRRDDELAEAKERAETEFRERSKQYEEEIRKIESERHVKELKAARLRDFYSLSACTCFAKNFNLPETGIRKGWREEPYVIEISAHDYALCFFHPDLIIAKSSVEVSCGDINSFWLLPDNSFEMTCSKLVLYLNGTMSTENDIDRFFLNPVLRYDYENTYKLYIRIVVESIDPGLDQSYGDVAKQMKYSLSFCISSGSGYNDTGGFVVCLSDIKVLLNDNY